MSQPITKPADVADTHQPRPITLKLILILGILSAYGPLTIDLYMPALPTIGQEFQTDRIQQTMSVYFLGMALGQLFMGPLSDKFGRKRPLLFGCALYALASLGCALSPSLEALLVCRFLQALGGCAGMVLTVSMVRDLFAVKDSARVFSYLVLVMGLAPILAPLIGGQLLLYSSWRVIFLVLMVFGLLCFVMVALGLPESLPQERRNKTALANLTGNYRQLLTDVRFIAYALPASFIGAGFTVYLASAALVFIEVYGVAPQTLRLDFWSQCGRAYRDVAGQRLVAAAVLERLYFEQVYVCIDARCPGLSLAGSHRFWRDDRFVDCPLFLRWREWTH